MPAQDASQFCPQKRSDQALAKDPTSMLVKSTLTSLEYDLLSSAIQREQQLDFREFRLFSRANSPIFSRTSGWTRIAKVSRAQGVPAAKEGLN